MFMVKNLEETERSMLKKERKDKRNYNFYCSETPLFDILGSPEVSHPTCLFNLNIQRYGAKVQAC